MKDRRIIQGAFGISLLVHLLFAAATWKLPFLEVDLSQARPLDPEVEVYLVPDDPESQSGWEMPRSYTAIPERLATENPPENPEYLAMHHSIAADNVLGGDSTSPTAEEEWIAAKVAIRQ